MALAMLLVRTAISANISHPARFGGAQTPGNVDACITFAEFLCSKPLRQWPGIPAVLFAAAHLRPAANLFAAHILAVR